MSDTVLKVENIYKQYRLGKIGTGSLKDDLQRNWARILGKEDPLSKVGETNQLDRAGGEYVWALKDISFEVKRGEVLGIIGKNGAGKSTLLKILSKVTGPTKGNIYVDGRIASLLEVGTGFHPELTGRENIFLNGAIMGMKKNEITSKLDEIVNFSGVEKYLETPVKRYSSGMYVRLAFAVAAHLEPDILIVDEVLAVGDIEFQKKAIGKMQDVSTGQGRTVLFVSHNMGAVQKLCGQTILLNNGTLYNHGRTAKIISEYYELSNKEKIEFEPTSNSIGYLVDINIYNSKQEKTNKLEVTQGWSIELELKLSKAIPHFILALGISNELGPVRTIYTKENDLDKGSYKCKFNPSQIFLQEGKYFLTVGLSSYESSFDYRENCSMIEIIRGNSITDNLILRTRDNGVILNSAPYEIQKI